MCVGLIRVTFPSVEICMVIMIDMVITDAVSAVGVPRTPQECENKLRCYTSEVKNKVCICGDPTMVTTVKFDVSAVWETSLC